MTRGPYVGGPVVDEFESAFAEYLGVRHVVGVASGTDAIALALNGLGVSAGDEVITVANTCIPTVAGVERAGATPVLVDVDESSWNLDPAQLESRLTDRTTAILPVHLYGRVAAMERILAFARDHGLVVVEDAAQAHGAALGGRRAGSLADAATFSFYPTKNLGAMGDAGAVATDSDEVADRVRLLRSYGERERYSSVAHGWNSRLDPIQAAILLAKLPHLDSWNARRREIAARYRRELAAFDQRSDAPADGDVHHLHVIRVRDRARFRQHMREHGVETLVHYPRAVHEHDAYAALGHPGLACSERLCREVVSIPLYPALPDAEVEQVIAAASLWAEGEAA